MRDVVRALRDLGAEAVFGLCRVWITRHSRSIVQHDEKPGHDRDTDHPGLRAADPGHDHARRILVGHEGRQSGFPEHGLVGDQPVAGRDILHQLRNSPRVP